MQFLERLAVRLGEEDVDEYDFEAEPYHVHEEVLPVDVFEADGVNEGACVCLVGGYLWK